MMSFCFYKKVYVLLCFQIRIIVMVRFSSRVEVRVRVSENTLKYVLVQTSIQASALDKH